MLPLTAASVTVTVTEALVLHPLLEDRGRITESIRILVSVDRVERNVFRSLRNESVNCSSFSFSFNIQFEDVTSEFWLVVI